MIVHPAVIVHGLSDAGAALALGAPVTLLSAPGAAAYAGCLWWREMIAAARREHPHTQAIDVLDCGGAPGLAMSALRMAVCRLVLADGLAWAAVSRIALRQGGFVLNQAPPAIDLAARDGRFRLEGWVRQGNTKQT
ncbi:MAG: hypothetical protein ACJ8AW_13730 [Rhodopila sp.]